MSQARIGVDIGGTFTDVVVILPDGGVVVRKVLTSPDKSSAVVAVARRLESELDLGLGTFSDLVHGTTVATNAILERKGALTALFTTEGFRDILEIGRLRMPQLYDMNWVKPQPLVPRQLRWEVAERVSANGDVLLPLDEPAAAKLAAQAVRQGIESVAICFLNSFANARHEELTATLLSAAGYEGEVTLSADLLRDRGEYERTSTAVVNAYVKPVVRRYLTGLEASLREAGWRGHLMVMQSSGGVVPFEAARERPVHTIESGPAAGVLAARELAGQMGYKDVLTFDMGGTTAKAALIEGGEFPSSSEYEVGGGISTSSRLLKGSGYLIRTSVIDIAEIGAGGGSVVWVDAGGALRVGPQSAGASPGPASYGLGGDEPTVTDANLLCGFLGTNLLAGRLALDAGLATTALQPVAEQRGMSIEECAYAVHRIANAEMVRVLRSVSSERGRDPRRHVLMAFGGAGPIHACHVAQELGMESVLVPPAAGVFSTFGLLAADVAAERLRDFSRPAEPSALDSLNASIGELKAGLASELERLGYETDAIVWRCWAELRYEGQSRGVRVELAPDGDGHSLSAVLSRFDAEYERTYAHRKSGHQVEFVRLHVRASLAFHQIAFGTGLPEGQLAAGGTETMRKAYFGPLGWLEARCFRERSDLLGVAGPAVLEEYDSTCLIPPGWRAESGAFGTLILRYAPNP